MDFVKLERAKQACPPFHSPVIVVHICDGWRQAPVTASVSLVLNVAICTKIYCQGLFLKHRETQIPQKQFYIHIVDLFVLPQAVCGVGEGMLGANH
jgi:hypothetical protein